MVVHGLGHQRIALRPVIAALGDEPDAHGIAAGHQPEAVVLDLVNPIGAGRGLVGRRWEAGFDAARPVSGQALTHTLNQHAANLGGGGGESSLTARNSAAAVDSISWVGRYTPTSATHRKAPRN